MADPEEFNLERGWPPPVDGGRLGTGAGGLTTRFASG
jgi:hypothetical protein